MHLTRKQAIEAGLTQYTTGKPCRNGHYSYRYTSSGTCATCVAASVRARSDAIGAVPRARDAIDQRRAQQHAAIATARRERDHALQILKWANIPIRAGDEQAVFELSIGLCLASSPYLERGDVLPNPQPIKGQPVYRVRVPRDQEQFLRECADTLWNRVSGVNRAALERYQLEQVAELEKGGEAPEGMPWK